MHALPAIKINTYSVVKMSQSVNMQYVLYKNFRNTKQNQPRRAFLLFSRENIVLFILSNNVHVLFYPVIQKFKR